MSKKIMPKPSFFRPLLKIDTELIGMMDRTRALVSQVRALNSVDAQDLENTLIDLTAQLLDAQQLVIVARRQEQTFRTK